MLKGIIGRVVGDPNEREIQKLNPLVEAINGLEPEMERRTEAELRAQTDLFRSRLAAGDTLDDLVVEAFATVREVAKRTVDMRPFDVQLLGGIVLHQGKVAEMKTGEGKTLVATMPVYLNALAGRGAHLVTVNDYLARRDALWMGPVYHLLGLSIGLLQSGAEQPAYLYDPDYQREPYPGLRPVPRQEAYAADITYGTNNEFGFDYLRDNLALTLAGRVQRPLYYAIVDEVDNIFVDEARTPLIISGPSGEPVEEYSRFAAIAPKLEPEIHYELDDKERSVFLTDEGLAVVERETGIENIYDEANYRYVHYMQQALKAQVIFLEGRDYIRQRKRIVLIDQHTGRLMPNRRLSEGLHQAIEAKEGVTVRPRDVTSATITIQNYFRMYEKLAGMSGTAMTEAEEFFKIYELDVVAIPTNKPVARADHADVVYRSEEAKLRAVARALLALTSQAQPVLVGTTSVEMSERLSRRLTGERLQMAAIAPRAAYALQDADMDREERASLRETMNGSLETMNSASWRRMLRNLELEPNALAPENLAWIADYLELPRPDEGAATVSQALEHAMREGIEHQVLNAKEHTREATVIARAGEPGAVTIATNMAGRGVDIKLGGELSDEVVHKAHQVLAGRGLDAFSATPAQMDSAIAEVLPRYAKDRDRVMEVGGLHVLGTERHEARRIDNQLRGRSGRQGEPGSSRFYLSLEDDLMRRFGRKDMLSKLMEQIGDDFPIEHNLVSRTIERAQTSVEGHNFDIRKHLLEYDDVLNRQRETIYDERLRILKSDDLRPEIWRMLEGQLDEYLERHQEPEEWRFVFAGLDDVVPLILPAPKAPFQGPLAFGSHLTAFPPFTISFLADQLVDQPVDGVRERLQGLGRQAARAYGDQISQTVKETAQNTLEKYEEQLGRYQALLDEKIEDYLQLMEERGQMPELSRLAQHLERTYPLPLTVPRDGYQMDLDDLRDHWLAEVENSYHRQACAGLVGRIQVRLPADVQLDRPRPAQVPSAKLVEEMERVRKLAAKQPVDEEGQRQIEQLAVTAPEGDPDPQVVQAFISTVKTASRIDFGRLDRLVGHLLGSYLHNLIGLYLEALGEEEGRVRRDLERLQSSVVEGKKGGRANHLAGVILQLNELVHLEIRDLETLLSQGVSHEYDKWAQRQLSEIEAEVARNPLAASDWSTIAEHLMATYYTERQVYDRGHRRRATWMPRLPLSFVAQAQAAGLDVEEVRSRVVDSLQWSLDQREQSWGLQERQRWETLSADDLEEEAYDSLVRYVGEQELGELRDQAVEELPADLNDQLRYALAVQKWAEQNLLLIDLPDAERVLERLGQSLEQEILDTPFGALEEGLQARAVSHLRQTGFLDDPAAQASLVAQRIGSWDRKTREEVARFWGQRTIQAHAEAPISELDADEQGVAVAFLQRRRRFVDEAKVQRFLVHERFVDLPPEIAQRALEHMADLQLVRVKKRKISSLDVKTRQAVTESLQRMGLFSDLGRRESMLSDSTALGDLESKIQAGFGAFLARERLDSQSLGEMDGSMYDSVLGQLRQTDALADPERLDEFVALRLVELNGAEGTAGADQESAVREALLDQQRSDLETKTMEELPAATRSTVHRVLEQQDYFVDRERVSWYERKTLAQLPSNLLYGLEEHLGRHRLAEIAHSRFSELPGEMQGVVLDHMDAERLFPDRAARLRLTQVGTLDELSDEIQDSVAHHLGRQWLVQLRDKRPPDLGPEDRDLVWAYLRDSGHFADEFKEELFAYQRLDEFDEATGRAVYGALEEQLDELLASQPIGALPEHVQAVVRAQLRQSDYFVDRSRLRQVETEPVQSLPADLRGPVEAAVGAHLLAGLDTELIADLPTDIQESFWRYLDEVGYFVDEEKRSRVLDRRLSDLGAESYQALVSDQAQQLREEIGDGPVAELDDDLRQGLRGALEALGYFESDEVRARVLGTPLGSMGREDAEALAADLGQRQIERHAEQTLDALPAAERDDTLAHLQSREWFLDPERLEQLQGQALRELEAGVGNDLAQVLRRQQQDRLRKQPVAKLDQKQRQALVGVLWELGLEPDERQMQAIQRRRLRELDQELYHYLVRELGQPVVSGWGSTQFSDLDDGRRDVVRAYLGRRIMGFIERRVLLHTISRLWIDYLTDIEDLRRGIGLEAYGQRDPLIEYKRRAFELFEELGKNIRRITVRTLFQQAPQPLQSR